VLSPEDHWGGYYIERIQAMLDGTWESTDTWGSMHAGILGHRPAAYFSAEFGIHESLPIYSGGLGVLAGDHLKSASDLGIPKGNEDFGQTFGYWGIPQGP